MHKKVIRGVTYYYTNVREGGRVKTIYLGRTREDAIKREAEVKGVKPEELKGVPKPQAKKIFYVLIIAIVAATVLIGGNLVGYLISVQEPAGLRKGIEVGVTFEKGSFLPQDALIEVSVGNQKSSLTFDELLSETGLEIAWDTGEFYYGGMRLSGSGVGYGFENRTTLYINTTDFGIPPLQVPGTYTVVTRIIYNSSVLEETSRIVELAVPGRCVDRDRDGYDTCQPDQDCNDQNPDIHPEAKDTCGNLIDENCDGYDEPCFVKLSDTIKSKNITYVKDEVVNQMEKKQQARVIIKLKDTSVKPQIEKMIAPEREIKGIISASVSELELIDLVISFTADDIELIQIDHPIRLVLDDVVNQTGVSQVWDSNVTGKGQTVCVVDSGIDYNHPNLSGSYLGGYDFINDDSDPMDDYGHGTYVSGIIAGIAPDSKILAAKVFGSSGLGYESDILAGIDYCIQSKDAYNVSVMLMSFGGGIYNMSCYCDSNLVANESNYAASKGILAIAASGNDGRPFLKAPACGTNVTSVGAVDSNDNIANFTNIEPLLDLLAPGVEVSSAKLGGGFETKNGTSISAAVVAGIAPLILENESLNPYELQFRLRSTGFLVAYNGTNYPRVDAYAALTNKITNNPYIQQGTQCEGTWEEYEPLAGPCDPCDTGCSGYCYLSDCSGEGTGCFGPPDGCGGCTDCDECYIVECCSGSCVQDSCGAECDSGTNCELKCDSSTNRHTSCGTDCDFDYCQCTGSQDCRGVCVGEQGYQSCSDGSGCVNLQCNTAYCSASCNQGAQQVGGDPNYCQRCTDDYNCDWENFNNGNQCSSADSCYGAQGCTHYDCNNGNCNSQDGCSCTYGLAMGTCGTECDSNDDCGEGGQGTCDTGSCVCTRMTNCATYKCFYIKNSVGTTKAIIDSAGNMDLVGTLYQNQAGPCSPPAGSFIIKDSGGNCRAYIDSTGTMWLDGPVYSEQSGPCTAPAGSFVIKNSAGQCKAFIDDTGTLWLDGEYKTGASI